MTTSGTRDEQLLRALYDSHARPLLAYVQRLVGGDRQRAEDIVQETLVRAWRNADRLTVESARPWLFTVARNLAVDAGRSRRARPTEVPPAVVGEVIAPDELDAALDAHLVADALGSLTPTHREVVIESFYHGRPAREIADLLGLPAGTVRSRMFYALRALRLALQERGVSAP
ncbi:MAG: sigma-70 family RNA polymerase sigma factor [Nocardioidaceae bacterium]